MHDRPALRTDVFREPKVPHPIAPLPGYEACIVLETYKDAGGNPRSRVALYVTASNAAADAAAGKPTATYTPEFPEGAWLVDLPKTFIEMADAWDVDQIAEAIRQGPGLPPCQPPKF